MQISLKMGLGGGSQRHAPPPFNAIAALGSREGFAIDFLANRMVVNDSASPVNNFDGDPQSKLTVYGADPWQVDPDKGLNISALRDFAIAMATSDFPYDAGAIHVYARYQLNAADSADQRYLFMVDNFGNDRFAVYTTSGAGFRLVSGDGLAADTEISSLELAANTEYRSFLGCDANGRSWVDDGGIQTNDQLHALAAATPSHVGIGGYPDRVLRGLDGYLAEVAVFCGDIALEKRLTLEPLDKLYGAEGDSHTYNVSFGMLESEFYPHRVGAGISTPLAIRNSGTSGQSSAQMLAQVSDFLSKGAPDVASIYAGSNDVDTSIMAAPAPSTTSFDVIDAGKLAVGGWVVVNGESRKIASISGASVGLQAALPAAPVSGDIVEIDTQANIQAWIQAVSAAGAASVAVIGSHYLNFPSGGDTPEVEQSLRATVRAKQRAAALAEGAIYVDTYAYMRDRIVSGQVTQGDWVAWHQGAADTHLNGAGEQVLADAIRVAVF